MIRLCDWEKMTPRRYRPLPISRRERLKGSIAPQPPPITTDKSSPNTINDLHQIAQETLEFRRQHLIGVEQSFHVEQT
jgi:hypothetical protein